MTSVRAELRDGVHRIYMQASGCDWLPGRKWSTASPGKQQEEEPCRNYKVPVIMRNQRLFSVKATDMLLKIHCELQHGFSA